MENKLKEEYVWYGLCIFILVDSFWENISWYTIILSETFEKIFHDVLTLSCSYGNKQNRGVLVVLHTWSQASYDGQHTLKPWLLLDMYNALNINL